ncbi:serine/threonine-protein kinase PRP4 homolog isoform X2 [Danaus plexippus]|uniref:serine/threonine-protein kinase PRP4 homolog isoform X2 n=1 Tax=Danaus plexippus TaxID=13037 RepID=UPI002AB0B686|nr:serine/threonine-protein kinase PRP4 homolog isoform X2 [Danaus plexippus]
MLKKNKSSQHKNPNIKTVSSETECYPPSPKKPKEEVPDVDRSPQNIDLSFLDEIDIDEIVNNLNDCDENVQIMNIEDENIKGRFECDVHKRDLTETSENTIEDTHTTIESYSSNNNDFVEKEHQAMRIDMNRNEVTSSANKISTPKVINKSLNDTYMIYNSKKLSSKDQTDYSVDSNIPSPNSVNGDNSAKIKIVQDNKYNKTETADSHDLYNKQNKTISTEQQRKLSAKTVSKDKDINEVALVKSKKDMKPIASSKDTVVANSGKSNDQNVTMILEKRFHQCIRKECSGISHIHSGRFSDILQCVDTDSKYYAVKLKHKCIGIRQQQQIIKRIQINTPKDDLLFVNIIADFFIRNKWCLIMDFYPKNLKELIKESKKNLHIDKIQELAHQLLTALIVLENKNIVHSDIQPSHILLDSTISRLKLCGFDEAYCIEIGATWPFQGPKCYRAPEILLGHSAGFSVDVWSTALVLHEMATGIQLFGGCIDDHVLYKQMCILGDLPYNIINNSRYRELYKFGHCVQKYKCGTHKQQHGSKTKNIIASTIHGAYFKHWIQDRDENQKRNDLKKIGQFISMLNLMLTTNPEHRPPVEFVYCNPFYNNFFSR